VHNATQTRAVVTFGLMRVRMTWILGPRKVLVPRSACEGRSYLDLRCCAGED